MYFAPPLFLSTIVIYFPFFIFFLSDEDCLSKPSFHSPDGWAERFPLRVWKGLCYACLGLFSFKKRGDASISRIDAAFFCVCPVLRAETCPLFCWSPPSAFTHGSLNPQFVNEVFSVCRFSVPLFKPERIGQPFSLLCSRIFSIFYP